MNLIAIPSRLHDQIGIDIPNTEILWTDCTKSKTIFEDITRCGLDIEYRLLDNGKTILWTDRPKYLAAGIIWDVNDLDNILSALSSWSNPRGDEIIFDQLHVYNPRGWAIGNPRSIVKWAACSLTLEQLDASCFPEPKKQDSFQVPTSRLVWLAYRIGLKVYGLS